MDTAQVQYNCFQRFEPGPDTIGNSSWAGHWLFCLIFINGWTRSYHFLWAPTCWYLNMCSWVSSGPYLGHLCDSVTSSDIFDFWCPIFSHPCMLFEVLICFNGPSIKNPDLIPCQSRLFHMVLSQPCLSCKYFWCLLPWIFNQIWWRRWDVTFTSSWIQAPLLFS